MNAPNRLCDLDPVRISNAPTREQLTAHTHREFTDMVKSAGLLDELETLLPDAVLDAQQDLDFMNGQLKVWRGLSPEMAALIFGSVERRNEACGGLGFRIGRQMNVVRDAKREAGIRDEIPEDCSVPMARGETSRRWSGD